MFESVPPDPAMQYAVTSPLLAFAARTSRLSPLLVPAEQCARISEPQLPQRERRTGARLFRRSTTVGHDRLARFAQSFRRLFD